MPSPFPGSDPYLEDQQLWPDFHHTFITYCREFLNDCLPDNYVARIDERVNLVEREAEEVHPIVPDVAVVRTAAVERRERPAGLAVASAPVIVPVKILDEERQVFLKIIHLPEHELVTVLELLSPSNKVKPGRTAYLAKRNATLYEPVHLVELDLLLRGRRLPMERPLPPGHYYAIVGREEPRPDSEVYAWTVRDPLPTIKVPLRAPDPDITLDLGAVYATAYARGRYDRSVDYSAPLSPPLAPEDRDWAEKLARGEPNA